MVNALAKLFIKDAENVQSPAVRGAYGTLCSILGIALNVLLFAGKFFAGTISKSVSITADAFNNLSDAGSSVITLIGFKLAGKKPDPDHPFGHGRMEYLSGLAVSVAILLMGWELATSSVDKIIHPQAVEFSLVSTAILVFTKTGHGGTDNVWFYDMTADGLSLDDKRTPVAENDIPDIIERFHNLDKETDRERTER